MTVLELAEPWARRELNLAVRADARLPAFAQALTLFLLNDPRVAATREGVTEASGRPRRARPKGG